MEILYIFNSFHKKYSLYSKRDNQSQPDITNQNQSQPDIGLTNHNRSQPYHKRFLKVLFHFYTSKLSNSLLNGCSDILLVLSAGLRSQKSVICGASDFRILSFLPQNLCGHCRHRVNNYLMKPYILITFPNLDSWFCD